MTTNEFLKQYVLFIIDSGFSKYSADQYKSYLRNIGKKLPSVANHLDIIASTEDADVQGIYTEQMNIAITNALKDKSCAVSKKKLHDYRCAVAVLHAFIDDLAWDKGKGAVAKPVFCGISEYDRKDIRRIFLSRVKTQDRLTYPYGVFAARVLCKIAACHKVKLFNKMVENVKFLVGADSNKYVCLKNIDKLIIATDGYTYIETKGKTYHVYTEVVENGVSKGYKKAVVSSMRDLSLDHDTPLYYALQAAFNNMPEYKKLSDSVKTYWRANSKKNASDFSIDYYNDEYSATKLNINEVVLLKEIGSFLDDTAITIMYTPYNSSKNKNNP